MSEELSPNQLPLAPLGAGDLIDRAVRLYRRHLFVLIRTAAPPVIIVAAGWVLFTVSLRQIILAYETGDLLVNVFLVVVAAFLIVTGYLSILVVMGGVTRKVSKGDWILVPAGEAHQYPAVEAGGLRLMSLHLPKKVG